jgi:hypothetical protein
MKDARNAHTRETASGPLGCVIIEFQRTSGSEQGTVSFGLLQLIALWAGNTDQARTKAGINLERPP